MDIPAVVGEYTQGSCCKSKKPTSLSARCKMRPISNALHAEQFQFPHQTRKNSRFACLNSRQYTRSLSQDEMNTNVTSGTQNSSLYPKSNWDEANFPCIGSINILRSTSYRTSVLTPFRKLKRLTKIQFSSIEDHQFQYSNLRKVLCNSSSQDKSHFLSSNEEVSQISTSTSRGAFPQK